MNAPAQDIGDSGKWCKIKGIHPSEDGTRIEVSCDMLVGHMRNTCTVGTCGLLFNIRRLQRELFSSEQRRGDALKCFVLANAVHCQVCIALVRLDYRPLSLSHL